jgi:hypothetical protein
LWFSFFNEKTIRPWIRFNRAQWFKDDRCVLFFFGL